MPFKQKVHTHCCSIIKDRIAAITLSLLDLKEAGESDSKSSAGDKYETSRAMLQVEKENLSKQLQQFEIQLKILEKINPIHATDRIHHGSLVKTKKVFFYLSVPIGKILVEETELFCISSESPLGKKFWGLKPGASVEQNGVNYLIEKIL